MIVIDGDWQDVAAHFLGLIPGGEYLLVVTDYYSRFFQADILKPALSSDIINCLELSAFVPQSFKTDNGPQFVSLVVKDYLKSNDVLRLTSTLLWPQANGEVARQNRSLLKSMRIAQATGKDLHKELNKFLLACRSSPHRSPAKMLLG